MLRESEERRERDGGGTRTVLPTSRLNHHHKTKCYESLLVSSGGSINKILIRWLRSKITTKVKCHCNLLTLLINLVSHLKDEVVCLMSLTRSPEIKHLLVLFLF